MLWADGQVCQRLYRFIRLRLGNRLSDREIARRWGMEWKSFSALRHGRRKVPRIDKLEALAEVLGVDPALVFEVARGADPEHISALINQGDVEALGEALMGRLWSAWGAEAAQADHPLRLQLEGICAAVFSVDLQGRFRDFNAEACRLAGRSREAMALSTIFELISPEQTPQVVAMLASAYRDRTVRGVELMARREQGGLVALEIDATRMDDPQGNAVGVQLTVRDVSQRQGREPRLQGEIAQLLAGIDAAPVACMVLDAQKRVLFANRRLAQICSLTAEEAVGGPVEDLFGALPAQECPVSRCLESRATQQCMSRMTNRAGEAIWALRVDAPILGSDGNVEKVVEVVVDMRCLFVAGSPAWISQGTVAEGILTDDGEVRVPGLIEKRQFVRVPIDSPVSYEASGLCCQGRARNLSRGGMFVETEAVLPVGTRLSLAWSLPAREGLVSAGGTVVWCAGPDTQSPPGMGVRFHDVSLGDERAIATFVVDAARRLAFSRRGATN